MDTRRTVLWIIFSVSLFMLWENWQNFVLLNQTPGYFYVAQTGLVGASTGASLPTHRTPFRRVEGPTTLEPGQDTLAVSFEAESGGVKLTKTYTFHRGSYQIDVRHA